jgi:methylmalonyl-CoA mutase
MFLHVRTSTFTKTRHDVHSNLVRNAIEAFAGAVGGCDSMYIAPFDETVGRPEEFSMRLARNQHLLLKEEAQLGRVVDPAAGSHAIEKLTDDLARAAWLFLQQIEAEGGMAEALKTGWVQARIAETQRKREKAVTSRRNVIVGTSAYPDLEEKPLPRKHIPRDEFLAERRRRIARLKAVRDNAAVRDALTRVALFAVSGEGSLVEAAMDAAKAGATIGEIVASLNRAAAPPPAVDPVVAARASKPFERLRERAEAWRRMNGSHPPVMLATMGPLGMRRARADFCAGFFGAGGFQAVEPPAFSTPAEAAKAIIAHPATLVVLCSDDATYPVAAPGIVAAVKAASPAKLVWIAGYPADSVDMLREAGVDGFVHIKADAVETLTTLQDQLGIGA